MGLALAAVWLGLNLAAWSTVFEPLPPTSGWLWLGLILAATIGTGMLAGRLHFVWLFVLSAVPGVAGWLVGWPQFRYREPLLIPWWTDPVVFVVLLAGWVAARLLPRRGGTLVGLALVAAPLPWVAWAVELQLDPVNLTPAHPRLIDLNAASWNGIRLGDESTRLRRRLGPPPVIDLDPESGDEVWRYGRQAFHIHGPTVAEIEVTDPDAQTGAGVGLGDSLEIARRAYPWLQCWPGDDAQRRCEGHAPSGALVLIGPDPIESIELVDVDQYR